MSHTGPLAERRILLTRAEHQAGELADALRALGAELLFLPGLAIHPPESFGPVDEALRRLDQFDWIVFTSQNAVGAFVVRARAAGKSLSGPRLAAVGPKTERALAVEGLHAHLVAPEAVAESLAEALSTQVRGRRVLLPRAEEARELLPEALRAAGASEVCVAPVYRAVEADSPELSLVAGALSEGKVDAVTFASARTVEAVVAQLERALDGRAIGALQRCHIFSIGPLTTQACRARGLEPVIEAHPHTGEGLIAALVKHLGRAVG